jgi:hypothetical protein
MYLVLTDHVQCLGADLKSVHVRDSERHSGALPTLWPQDVPRAASS